CESVRLAGCRGDHLIKGPAVKAEGASSAATQKWIFPQSQRPPQPNQTKPNQTKPQQARIREQKKWAT
ncbi:hypothetical protein, partial [Pseudomonas sp. HD6422]|uniref:hypothetical protein n=1 Tax=Pseudomonas sp. HD6422 TaxID=2860318 RepID=UPI0021BA6ACA